MNKKRQRKPRPVCPQHWNSIRKEALATLPFWSRIVGGRKVNQYLQEKGFVQSDNDCLYCRTSDTGSAEAP